MAAMAKAAMEPIAGVFIMAPELELETMDRMAEEALLAMELTPEAADETTELIAEVLTEAVAAWAEATKAAMAIMNLFILKIVLDLVGMGLPAIYTLPPDLGAQSCGLSRIA